MPDVDTLPRTRMPFQVCKNLSHFGVVLQCLIHTVTILNLVCWTLYVTDAPFLCRTLNFNDEPMYVGGVMTIDPIQERPGQVDSDDFVGCIQSVFVNGRQLNMSAPIQARGISDKCQRVADACRDSPCGAGATCLDRWSRHVCLCPGGVMAPDCSAALEPSSFQGGHVEFSVTDRHRRRQLVPRLFSSAGWRRRREVAARPDKTLSMRVRTVDTDGVVLYAATNNDFTLLQVMPRLGCVVLLMEAKWDNYLGLGYWVPIWVWFDCLGYELIVLPAF